MKHLDIVKRLGCSTALVGALALPAFAQQNQLTDEQISNLDQECRAVLQTLGNRDNLPDGTTREETLELLRSNDPAACTEYRTTYLEDDGGSDTDTASAEAEEQSEETDVARERVEISEEALIEGLARVRVPEPEVDVDVPSANVRVMAGQPQVRVQEGQKTIEVQQEQPQIAVEIPEIIVRVEIPAPKLFIRSDDPSVEVSSANPRIEVQQGEPRVSVRQGEPEIAVDLDVDEDGSSEATANAGSNVTDSEGSASSGGDVRVARGEPTVEIVEPEDDPSVQYAEAQPQVNYTGSEPNVTVSMAQEPRVEIAQTGEISVTYESAQERQDRRQAEADAAGQDDSQQQNAVAQNEQTEGQQQDTVAQNQQTDQQGEAPSQQGDTWVVTIADLMDMPVRGVNGNDLGSPEAFVREGDRLMMVISGGGFLGLGDTEVGVPLSRVAYTEDALILQRLSEQEIADASDFTYDENMRVADDLEIRVRQ